MNHVIINDACATSSGGLEYVEDDSVWICCDGCDNCFDLKCTDVCKNIPEEYFCEECRQ